MLPRVGYYKLKVAEDVFFTVVYNTFPYTFKNGTVEL